MMHRRLNFAGTLALVFLASGASSAPIRTQYDDWNLRIANYELLPVAEEIARDLEQLPADDEGRWLEIALLSRACRLGGDYASAYLLSGAARAGTRQWTDPYLRAETLLADALSARLANLHDRAESALDEGLEILEAFDGPRSLELRADLHQARANWMRRREPWPECVREYEVAYGLRLSADANPRPALADNLVWMGHALMAGDENEAALERLGEAEQILRDAGMPDHPLMGPALHPRAVLALRDGNCEFSMALLTRSMAHEERTQRLLIPGFSENVRQPHGYQNMVICLAQESRHEEAFAQYQRSFLGYGGSDNWLMRRSSSPLRAQLEEWESRLESSGVALRRQLPFSDDEPEPVDFQLLLEFVRARVESWSLAVRMREQFASTQVAIRTRREFVRGLADDEAILCWAAPGPLSDRGEALAMVLRADAQSDWVSISVPSAIHLRAAQRMERASGWPARVQADARLDAELAELHRSCFAPLLPWLDGVRELLILPRDLDTMLPLGAWLDESGHALLERYAIRYLPVFEVAVDARSDWVAPTSAVVVGDADYGADAMAPVGLDPRSAPEVRSTVISRSVLLANLDGDPDARRAIPRLPFSRWEVEQVSSSFPRAHSLVGAQAIESELAALGRTGEVDHAQVIHLSGHALVHPRYAERSAILLGDEPAPAGRLDGNLYCEEMGRFWNLSAELVTLSGCQTAGRAMHTFQPPPSFEQVLLRLGAKSVVSSRWKVDDAATALLMARFYANWMGQGDSVASAQRRRMSRSEALREASLWLRDFELEDGVRPFAHPIYWAAFVLSGASEKVR